MDQVEHIYIGPGEDTNPPAPGSAGVEEWVFTALKPGSGTIVFEHSQPWDGGEKRAWVLTIDVEVRFDVRLTSSMRRPELSRVDARLCRFADGDHSL